jgi:Lon protease-like protein
MPAQLIPLFPLQAVAFPRTRLQLHIFEERYKEMVGNAIRDHSEFGVVLAREDGIVSAGCTVVVEKVLETYSDGRMDILTRGLRRFEVVELSGEKAYLQAEVSFFDDDDAAPAPAQLRDQALAYYSAISVLAAAQGRGEPDLADPQLSFQLAQALPDPDFLYALLARRSETGRLKDLNRYLAEFIPRQRRIERVKRTVPTNGSGGGPAEL